MERHTEISSRSFSKHLWRRIAALLEHYKPGYGKSLFFDCVPCDVKNRIEMRW